MIAITDPLERKPIRDIINKLPDDKKQYFIQSVTAGQTQYYKKTTRSK